MSLVPSRPRGLFPERDYPGFLDERRSREVVRRRWRIRAAQWRARELAEEIFGPGVEAILAGFRAQGPLHGLLRLDVPFSCLDSHRALEARFLASAGEDPVLAGAGLVYVIGPGPV